MEESKLSEFKDNGFCLFKSRINYQTLMKAQKSFHKILNICNNRKYDYVRVYDDYSNKINLAGIEMIFDKDIIDQNIINLVQESQIISIAKRLLNEDELVMSLSRYHVTKNFTHLGIWHRDGEPNKLDSVQLNIYLYDETGMEIIPNSHTRDNFEYESKVLKQLPYNDLPEQLPLKVNGGDICAFNPSLIHRGKTLKDRAHLHFRFTKKSQVVKKNNIIEKN